MGLCVSATYIYFLRRAHSLTAHLKWDSALSAIRTADHKYFITSPNCPFVPKPLVGRVVVTLRADYRYGPPDPIQWPQVLSEGFEYLCAIRRRIKAPDPRAAIWADPQEGDFKIIEGCEFKTLGLFTKASLKPLAVQVRELTLRISSRPDATSGRLKWLDAAMKQACDRLYRFPCTYRDACVQFRETQRYWLMATAFIEYHDILAHSSSDVAHPVRSEFMGAFTSQPHVVQQLFAAGFPVWFVRSDASIVEHHLSIGSAVKPSDVCTALGPGGGYELYTGLSGPRHLQCTARGGHTYIDVSKAPLLAVYADGGYAPPAPQKPRASTTKAAAVPAPRVSLSAPASTSSPSSSTSLSKPYQTAGGPIRPCARVEAIKARHPCECALA